MKFQELLFDNNEIQSDDKLSQILSELDLMVGSEIDEFGWFLTDYFDDPEEFSNNIEIFTKDDVIRMLNTLAKDENSDEIFSDILHGLEFVEVEELEDLEESFDKDNEYKLAFKNHKIYYKGNVIFDVDRYIKYTDVHEIADDFNRFAKDQKWGSNVVFVRDDNQIKIDCEFFDYEYDDSESLIEIEPTLSNKEFKRQARLLLLYYIDFQFNDNNGNMNVYRIQDIIDDFTNSNIIIDEPTEELTETSQESNLEESENNDLNFENNKIYLNNKLIFDIDNYTENTDAEIIANDFNDYADCQKWGGDVAEITDDCTVIIDPEWFIADAEEITETEFRDYAKQSLILIIDDAFSNLDTLEENLQNFFECFVHGVKLNEAPNINPANKSTQKVKFRKKINRAWNAHSKSYNKAHAVKNRVERIANGTARKQKRYGKVYKRRLSLARKNRSNLTKRKARFSRIRPKTGFGTNQAKQNLKH